MAYHALTLAFSMMAAVVHPDTAPQTGAPPAPPTARYCLRVDPEIGSRIEAIRCETREGWAQLEVDVDQEWAMWGVRVISSTPRG